jgi:hypothetical protein
LKGLSESGQASVEYAVSVAVFAGIACIGARVLQVLLQAIRSGTIHAVLITGKDF